MVNSKKQEQQLTEGNQKYERGLQDELKTENVVGKERTLVKQLQDELNRELAEARAKIAKVKYREPKTGGRISPPANGERTEPASTRDAREKASTQKTSTPRSSNPEKQQP